MKAKNFLFVTLFGGIAGLMIYIAPSHATRYVYPDGRHAYTVNDGINATVTLPATPPPTTPTPRPATPRPATPRPATPRPKRPAGGASILQATKRIKPLASAPSEGWDLLAKTTQAEVRDMTTEEFQAWVAALPHHPETRRVQIAAASVAVALDQTYIERLPETEEGLDIAQGWAMRKIFTEQRKPEVRAAAARRAPGLVQAHLQELAR